MDRVWTAGQVEPLANMRVDDDDFGPGYVNMKRCSIAVTS